MNTFAHRAAPRRVFALDAVLAASLGLALVALASPIHQLAGGGLSPEALRVVGLGLLPWAAHNAFTARESPLGSVNPRVQVVGDALWILASVALCAANWSSLTLIGRLLYLSQLVVVGAIFAAKLRVVASLRAGSASRSDRVS